MMAPSVVMPLQDVSNEPPTPLGSFDTSSTTFRRKAVVPGAARGVTNRRSFGTSLAKPVCAVTAGGGDKQSGSTLVATPGTTYAMTAVEVGCHVMRGDLDLAIRDLQRCRSMKWISEEMRGQLSRCLFELTAARRMCP
jgi:hypothetical protein